MDNHVQSRINRSLVIHNLDNLVYGKRQRKQVVTPPLPVVQQTQNHKVQRARVSQQVEIKKRIEKTVLEKKVIKKVHVDPKPKKGRRINNEEDVEKSNDKEESIKESLKKVRSSLIKKESISIAAKSNSSYRNTNQNLINKMEKNTKKTNQKQSKDKANPPPTQNRLKKQIKLDSQPIKNSSGSPSRPRGRPRKQFSQPKVEKKQIVRIPQPPKQQQIVEEPSGKRIRQAKMNSVRYNDDFDKREEDDDQIFDKGYSKKKRINKYVRNKKNKPYSLNRIFRKEKKRQFGVYSLSVDFHKISLREVSSIFGKFDLIHCSLPIDYLQQLRDFPQLIDRGFIFIWVQKGQTQIGYHLLNRWGFDVIDQIVWIKCKEEQGTVEADYMQPINKLNINEQKKELFLNMKSTCLVGYKCPLGNKAEYRTKVSNNIIFAPRQQGLKKPSQIYQISDLMMPGAKKLEIGGIGQTGWLSLTHQESTIRRCHKCLTFKNLYIHSSEAKLKASCTSCLIEEIIQKDQQINSEDFFKVLLDDGKVKIKQQVYFENQLELKCIKCNKDEDTYLCSSFSNQNLLCLTCVQLKQYAQVTLALRKQVKFNQQPQQCSLCKKYPLIQLYFQCNKCKNHGPICKQCFWSSAQKIQHDQKGKQIYHDWKLKLAKNQPLMKFNCFCCKVQLHTPFWCCETCQGWFWCGNCPKSQQQIHPHYQTDQHQQYLLF